MPFSSSMVRIAPSMSAITRLSVISISSEVAARSVSSRTRATSRTSPGSANWRADRLTAMQRPVAGVLPGAVLAAGGAQHPGADRDDQPGLLGQVDETVRAHQAQVRVAPADQRLEPDHRAAAEIDLGLVIQFELVMQQRTAQRAFERQAFAGP